MSIFKFNTAISFSLLIVFMTGVSLSIPTVSAQTTVISDPYSLTVQNVLPQVSAGCLNITHDLYYGLSDYYDSSILNMQKYLAQSGYLLATPNGYFGSGTLAAVKKFQAANGISNTGRVGPQTRARLKELTCVAVVQSQPAAVAEALSSSQNPTILSPQAGQTLIGGQKQNIRWDQNNNSLYDILLERDDGYTAGYISANRNGGNYEWEIGQVYSPASQSNIMAEPGRYRIKLRNTGWGGYSGDQYSGYFDLQGTPLVINQVLPETVAAGSVLAIYGSGFGSLTSLAFDDLYSNRIKPVYLSSDGKLMVINVPNLYAGRHTLWLNDFYASGATSTPSNTVSIRITK